MPKPNTNTIFSFFGRKLYNKRTPVILCAQSDTWYDCNYMSIKIINYTRDFSHFKFLLSFSWDICIWTKGGILVFMLYCCVWHWDPTRLMLWAVFVFVKCDGFVGGFPVIFHLYFWCYITSRKSFTNSEPSFRLIYVCLF